MKQKQDLWFLYWFYWRKVEKKKNLCKQVFFNRSLIQFLPKKIEVLKKEHSRTCHLEIWKILWFALF